MLDLLCLLARSLRSMRSNFRARNTYFVYVHIVGVRGRPHLLVKHRKQFIIDIDMICSSWSLSQLDRSLFHKYGLSVCMALAVLYPDGLLSFQFNQTVVSFSSLFFAKFSISHWMDSKFCCCFFLPFFSISPLLFSRRLKGN